MLDYNTMGACVLVLTLVSVFVMVILIRRQRTGKDVIVWLVSGLVGILLGAGGSAAGLQLLGYEVTQKFVPPPGASLEEPAEMGSSEMMTGGGPSPGDDGGGSPGGMDMMMGMGGGGGGGRGGSRGPSPKRELTSLVRKVDLLTGDIVLNLSDDQATALGEVLTRIQAQESMTDEQATTARDEILALLDEDQAAKQESIGLPVGGSGGRGGRGGGDAGGESASEDANPFTDGQNATAIQSLLERIGSGTTASSQAETDAPEPDAPETDAPEPDAPETLEQDDSPDAGSTEAPAEEPSEPDAPV